MIIRQKLYDGKIYTIIRLKHAYKVAPDSVNKNEETKQKEILKKRQSSLLDLSPLLREGDGRSI